MDFVPSNIIQPCASLRTLGASQKIEKWNFNWMRIIRNGYFNTVHALKWKEKKKKLVQFKALKMSQHI